MAEKPSSSRPSPIGNSVHPGATRSIRSTSHPNSASVAEVRPGEVPMSTPSKVPRSSSTKPTMAPGT